MILCIINDVQPLPKCLYSEIGKFVRCLGPKMKRFPLGKGNERLRTSRAWAVHQAVRPGAMRSRGGDPVGGKDQGELFDWITDVGSISRAIEHRRVVESVHLRRYRSKPFTCFLRGEGDRIALRQG